VHYFAGESGIVAEVGLTVKNQSSGCPCFPERTNSEGVQLIGRSAVLRPDLDESMGLCRTISVVGLLRRDCEVNPAELLSRLDVYRPHPDSEPEVSRVPGAAGLGRTSVCSPSYESGRFGWQIAWNPNRDALL